MSNGSMKPSVSVVRHHRYRVDTIADSETMTRVAVRLLKRLTSRKMAAVKTAKIACVWRSNGVMMTKAAGTRAATETSR